jgi:hypothetical protein
MAADQRYCLSCGTRRGDARLPFLDILRGEFEPVPVMAPAAVAPPPDRLRPYTPLIGLTAVLLLALVAGLLLGHWATGDAAVPAAATTRPQIIRIEGGTAATTAPTTAPSTTGGHKKAAAKHAKRTGHTAATTKSQGLDNLKNLSGKDYQKQVDKLGKTISTGGAAPPKDNKAPAGGGKFQDIG